MSKQSVCYKCRWVVEDPGGFFRRKNPNGPCDRCLGQMTAFQVADEQRIWLKQLPPKAERIVPKPAKPEVSAPDKV